MKRKFEFDSSEPEGNQSQSLSTPSTTTNATQHSEIPVQETAADAMQRLNNTPILLGTEARDAQIFTCEGSNADFDLQSADTNDAIRQGHTSQQDKTALITDPNQFQVSQQKFKELLDLTLQQRKQVHVSKQAQIANRLQRVRAELRGLQKSMKINEASSQSGGSSAEDIKQLEEISKKLEHIYGTKGFKDLLKRPDLFQMLRNKSAVQKPDEISLDQILSRLNNGTQQETIGLVVDHSKKDVGTLIKLHSLQKRVGFINHVLGGWKPTARFQTLTAQIKETQCFLDLLDSHKIAYYIKRVEVINAELEELQGKHATMTTEERLKELGHPKDLHERLFQACQSVKTTFEELPKLVERMEQRRKLHEVCAKIVLDATELEVQQRLVIDRFGENSELLKEVREGMEENLKICKSNLELVK